MEPWRTAIVDKDETHIRLRGYDITLRLSGSVAEPGCSLRLTQPG